MEDATEHREFPKMLYKDGVVRTEEGRPVPPHHAVTVNDAEEEAEARADGFADAAQPETPEEEEETEREDVAGEDDEAPDAPESPEPSEAEPAEGAEGAEEPGAEAPAGE